MDQREKRYVPVIVRFDAEGKLRPLEIEFDEGHKYPVDKILDIRRAACQSVGRRGRPLHLHDPGAGDLPVDGKGALVRLRQAIKV